MVTDPVCGMEIERDQAVGHEEYDGSDYFFCSEECHEEFEANPQRYATPFVL